jgi:hypothetical protein
MIKKSTVFKILLAVWIGLWMFFLIREDKSGQYSDLKYLYSQGYNEKVRYIAGDQLSEIIAFCADNFPDGATYDITGLEKFSIAEVRARYYLWPHRRTSENPDFIVIFGAKGKVPAGYQEHVSLPGAGSVLVRKDLL